MKEFIGIIPARWASSRFPGKPLAMIGGKAMIERVYGQAHKALSHVVVATDDKRIHDCVSGFGGVAVMTRNDHRCGTERCMEAYGKMKNGSDSPWYKELQGLRDEDIVIVNIQGDEPFIQPEQVRSLCGLFENKETEIGTLVKAFKAEDGWEKLVNPNTPKVVWSEVTGEALLFSRSVIPYMRGVAQEEWLQKGRYYGHIGMYAYRGDVLRRIVDMKPVSAETAESLEQLRWLENGVKIRVAVSNQQSIGIDTPEDLRRAEEFLAETTNNNMIL